MKDWKDEQDFDLDEVTPPPLGQVIIGKRGTVVMCQQTYDQYAEDALLAAIRQARTGEE